MLFQSILSKTDKNKKYWIHKPDIDKILTVDHAIDMLKFAYLSLRLKYKRKQKKNVDCYWFKDAINIQRYTHYYKSRQFLFDNQTRIKKN